MTRAAVSGARRSRTPVAVEQGVRDGACHRTAHRLAGASRNLVGMIDQHHVDGFGRILYLDDRVGLPVDAAHALLIEQDLLSRSA